VVRMAIWSLLVLYLACDFFLLSGPLKRELRRMFPTEEQKIAEAVAEGICARVYNAPIYLSQVDRRVRENLWRRGREPGKVSDEEMRMLRRLAMDDLIVEALLRIKVRVNIEQARVSKAEVDAELARFEKRFDSAEQLDAALAAQGIDGREELRLRMQARLEQEKYVLSKIESGISVSDEEARQWYADHPDELTTPERRQARHIFLATLNRPSDEARQILEGYLATIDAGQKSFAELAQNHSEDLSSKVVGGDLGWMSKDRLPGDFAAPLFAMPENKPSLVRTKLGWHIIEVTGVKPPELHAFETMKTEIIDALRDARRQEAIEQYRHQLRLLNHERVEIYPPLAH